MSFADQMNAFVAKSKKNLGAIREGTDDEMFRSIVDGSELTGAPGQPVGKSGKLRDSWTQEKSATDTVTSSDAPYATAVEENWGNVDYSNHGPHSLKITVVAFPRVVEAVAQRVAGL